MGRVFFVFHAHWASGQAFVASFSHCHSGWWLRLHLESKFRALWQSKVVGKLQRASGGWPRWSGRMRDLMEQCRFNCTLQLPNGLQKRCSLNLHGGAQGKNESLWSQVWNNRLPPGQQEKTFLNKMVNQPSRCLGRPWNLGHGWWPSLDWAKPQAACSNVKISSAEDRGLDLTPPEVPPELLFCDSKLRNAVLFPILR